MDFAGDDSMHRLRTGFGRLAEDYQRTRPVCPPQLVAGFDTFRDEADTWLWPGDV